MTEERAFWAFLWFCVAVTVGFWSAVGFVVVHFLLKVW